VPILPVGKIVPYEEALGIKTTRTEVSHSGPLPQHFGDEFGWQGMVEAVASAYNSLPPEQVRERAYWLATMGKRVQSTFSARATGCPTRSVPIRTTISGGRGSTRARA
jgi:hypothetical protein